MGSTHVGVAKSDEVHETGLGKCHNILLPAVPDPTAGQVDFSPGRIAGKETGQEKG